VLESALAIATGEPVIRFSEQQVVDCQNWYDGCYGCSGGWPIRMHESTKQYPILREDSYRAYNRAENNCQIATNSGIDTSASSHLASVANAYEVTPTPAGIKEELCKGPIGVALQARGAFSSFGSGVMTSEDCPFNYGLDHAVGVIGWTVRNGIEAMVVRNSWGTGWGEAGYAYLALDTGNNGWGPCGIYQYLHSVDMDLSVYNNPDYRV